MDVKSVMVGISLSSVLYLNKLEKLKKEIDRLEKLLLLKEKELDIVRRDHLRKRSRKTLEVFDISD